jgi:predicted ribosome quality control (RQC) complex YloA/Tae2 family protein
LPTGFLVAKVVSQEIEGLCLCSSPSAEDIAFAADLAAYFSKARSEGKVEVVKAVVGNLKKPTGAPPGKVALI